MPKYSELSAEDKARYDDVMARRAMHREPRQLHLNGLLSLLSVPLVSTLLSLAIWLKMAGPENQDR